jgi:hypothetical protein
MSELLFTQVLYLNGLERTKVGLPEKILAGYLRLRGIEMAHASVDWHSDGSFQEIFDATTYQAEQKLQQHGKLAIVGVSAGGSLGLNVFQRLRRDSPESDVSLVSLSAWLNVGDMERLDYTALHRPGKQPSPAFKDSVVHCSNVTLPALTQADRARILTIHPLADEVVPLYTMSIEGVEARTVPIGGHVLGISVASLMLPRLLASNP